MLPDIGALAEMLIRHRPSGAVGLDPLADYAQAVVDAGSFRDAPIPDGFEEIQRPEELGTVTYTGDQVSVTLLNGDRRSAAFVMPPGPPGDESVPEPLAGDRGWLLDHPDGSVAVVWLDADRFAVVESIGEPLSAEIAASVRIVPGESVEEGPLAAALSQRFGGIPADASLVAAGDATPGCFLAVTFPGADDRTCVAVAINADGGIVVPQDCGTEGELLAACCWELPNGTRFWVWVQGDVEAVDVTVNDQPVHADIEYVAGFTFASVRSADTSDDLVVTSGDQLLCRG